MINLQKQDLRKQVAEKELAYLEVAYAKVQQDLDVMEMNKDFMKAQILTNMAILFPGEESAKWTNEETGGTLTRVFATRFKFNVAKFIAILPAKILDKVTKPMVDSKMYVAAIETGLIDNEMMTMTGATEQIQDIRLRHEGGKA
jgi:hypothetical protein